jgi:hypothetical protein
VFTEEMNQVATRNWHKSMTTPAMYRDPSAVSLQGTTITFQSRWRNRSSSRRWSASSQSAAAAA